MSRALVSILAFALLLGMGTLAVLARPGADMGAPMSQTGQLSFAAVAAPEPNSLAAPVAVNKYNIIALPLDVRDNWATDNIPFTAKGLAQYIGTSSVVQVLQWKASTQRYDIWFPGGNYGFINGVYTTTPFSLVTGGAYRLLLNNSNPSLATLSLTGSVPSSGTIKFTLVGATSCRFNDISLPLEQSTITNATALATSMGGATNVNQVLRWNAIQQSYDMWFPGGNYGFVSGVYTTTPFTVQLGYPYQVCLKAGANGVLWP